MGEACAAGADIPFLITTEAGMFTALAGVLNVPLSPAMLHATKHMWSAGIIGGNVLKLLNSVASLGGHIMAAPTTAGVGNVAISSYLRASNAALSASFCEYMGWAFVDDYKKGLMNTKQKTKELIEKAATLHDIGKIGIRDSVLQKEGKLTPEEYAHIQEHVKITHNILDNICMTDDFREITEIACSHHEKYDGSGYYRHLKGEDIPYGGRILAVADVFDAITSKRHYRDKMPIKNVIDILIKDSGTHFDKSLVDVFLKITADKIVKVFLTENHSSFKSEDAEILSRYTLMDIYNFILNENVTSDQKGIVELFNYYYSGNVVNS